MMYCLFFNLLFLLLTNKQVNIIVWIITAILQILINCVFKFKREKYDFHIYIQDTKLESSTE